MSAASPLNLRPVNVGVDDICRGDLRRCDHGNGCVQFVRRDRACRQFFDLRGNGIQGIDVQNVDQRFGNVRPRDAGVLNVRGADGRVLDLQTAHRAGLQLAAAHGIERQLCTGNGAADASCRAEIMLPSSVSAAVPSVTDVYFLVRQS